MAMIIRRPSGPVGPSGPTGATQGGKAAVASPQAGASTDTTGHDTSDPWRPSTEAVQGSVQTKVAAQSATAGPSARLDEQGTAKPGKHNFDIKPVGSLRNVADTLSTVGDPNDEGKRGGMSPITFAEKMKGKGRKPVNKMYPSAYTSWNNGNAE